MKKDLMIGMMIFTVVLTSGCARVTKTVHGTVDGTVEVAKVMWGSSTKALEEARVDAVSKIYKCSSDECFDTLLGIAQKENEANVALAKEKAKAAGLPEYTQSREIKTDVMGFTVFMKDKKKGQVVLMGIPGSIATTEVGVFFSSLGPQQTKVEISSLSDQAKRTASETIFARFDKVYEQADKSTKNVTVNFYD